MDAGPVKWQVQQSKERRGHVGLERQGGGEQERRSSPLGCPFTGLPACLRGLLTAKLTGTPLEGPAMAAEAACFLKAVVLTLTVH